MDAEDAKRAVEAGVSGLVVSNHGARNLDTVPATVTALPRVAEVVAGRVPIVLDGGIRRGTDVLKGLALGASAVAIGRPQLHGLAVDGSTGVSQVVTILRTELEMAMALTGRTSLAAIDRSVLWRRSVSRPEPHRHVNIAVRVAAFLAGLRCDLPRPRTDARPRAPCGANARCRTADRCGGDGADRRVPEMRAPDAGCGGCGLGRRAVSRVCDRLRVRRPQWSAC